MNIGAIKSTFECAKKNERHHNAAETRYWCDQYRMLAKWAIEQLEKQQVEDELDKHATELRKQYLKPEPPMEKFCIYDMVDTGHHSLQLVFKSRKHANEFKAAHGINQPEQS